MSTSTEPTATSIISDLELAQSTFNNAKLLYKEGKLNNAIELFTKACELISKIECNNELTILLPDKYNIEYAYTLLEYYQDNNTVFGGGKATDALEEQKVIEVPELVSSIKEDDLYGDEEVTTSTGTSAEVKNNVNDEEEIGGDDDGENNADESNEDPDDLQVSWELFETSRISLLKLFQSSSFETYSTGFQINLLKSLCNVYEGLALVLTENEFFDQACIEFYRCLGILLALKPYNTRDLCSCYSNLASNSLYKPDTKKAMNYYKAAARWILRTDDIPTEPSLNVESIKAYISGDITRPFDTILDDVENDRGNENGTILNNECNTILNDLRDRISDLIDEIKNEAIEAEEIKAEKAKDLKKDTPLLTENKENNTPNIFGSSNFKPVDTTDAPIVMIQPKRKIAPTALQEPDSKKQDIGK